MLKYRASAAKATRRSELLAILAHYTKTPWKEALSGGGWKFSLSLLQSRVLDKKRNRNNFFLCRIRFYAAGDQNCDDRLQAIPK